MDIGLSSIQAQGNWWTLAEVCTQLSKQMLGTVNITSLVNISLLASSLYGALCARQPDRNTR